MRHDEAALANAIEKYLFDAGGTATIRQIRRALPRYLQLSAADRGISRTRPGEELWEQQVRNVVCHRYCSGNPVEAGKFSYSPNRLTLAHGPQGDLFNP